MSADINVKSQMAVKRLPALTVLLADDDEDDRMLAQDAMQEAGTGARLMAVNNGAELLDYLFRRGDFAAPVKAPRPDLILLDLNMPHLDGREALRRIKSDVHLRRIPVVVLTTSKAPQDVSLSYDEGANSYVTKPVSYEGLIAMMKDLGHYWAETVQLPQD